MRKNEVMGEWSATLTLGLLQDRSSERSRWRGGRCRVSDVGCPDSAQISCGSQGGVPVTHLRKMMLEELQGRKSLR
jgi:hypothetical protein